MSSGYETGRFAHAGDLSQVTSHTDAAQVVQHMLADLREHPSEWENHTLERFLDALAAALEDLPSRYANHGQQFPQASTWKLFAEALVTASGYE